MGRGYEIHQFIMPRYVSNSSFFITILIKNNTNGSNGDPVSPPGVENMPSKPENIFEIIFLTLDDAIQLRLSFACDI